MPTNLGNIARYVRSKNAGPFWVTIDIFCDSDEDFDRVKESQSLCAENIANIYNCDASLVRRFDIRNLRTIKISYPRNKPQGHREERDMHAGQQFVPLLDLVID